MVDCMFEFDFDAGDAGNGVLPEQMGRAGTDERSDGGAGHAPPIVGDALDTAGPQTSRSTNGALATSVPISIPAAFTFRRTAADEDAADSEEFMPPHKLSQRTSHMPESVPLSSSSLIRTRNKVFESTGFLPNNSTQGFLVSRSGNPQSTVPHVPASPRLHSYIRPEIFETHSEPGIQQPHEYTKDLKRTATMLSIAASIPERGPV